MVFDLIAALRSKLFVDRRGAVHRRHAHGTRKLGHVDALVLHQTGFTRGNTTTAYDNTTAHFVILPDGTILQLYDEEVMLWASSGLNTRSVAVEFVGNFPAQSGRWWRGNHDHNIPSERQVYSGRALAVFLKVAIGVNHVFAHRQGEDPNRRGNCPGPHVWYNVGEWARGAGFSDGGPGFKVLTGAAIPAEWREARFALINA